MEKRKTKITEADSQIGRNLRAMREVAQVSQKDLAQILGITFQQLQKYESGKNRLPAARLFMLVRFFGVPYENFFHGIDECNASCMAQPGDDPLTAKVIYQMRSVQDRGTKLQICRLIEIMLSAPSSGETAGR